MNRWGLEVLHLELHFAFLAAVLKAHCVYRLWSLAFALISHGLHIAQRCACKDVYSCVNRPFENCNLQSRSHYTDALALQALGHLYVMLIKDATENASV
jgi:hypothetical protein